MGLPSDGPDQVQVGAVDDLWSARVTARFFRGYR